MAAGHDAFAFDRVEHHLQGAWGPLADHRGRFLALGEYHGQFNMTALALRTSDFANGVSRLHGDVTRQMWEPLLQEREKTGQRPLTHITNGVHAPDVAVAGNGAALRDASRSRLARAPG